MTTAEEPLGGGSVSTVVRVGNTVRRTLARWSDAVHAVLQHLESVGFDGAPRFLGIDDKGREVLSWIEGEPATRPWPATLRSTQGLVELASLLRDYHDAVASFAAHPKRPSGRHRRRPPLSRSSDTERTARPFALPKPVSFG